MRDPNASDFCYYPFMQILLTSDGRYRPCSKHQDYVTHGGRELNVKQGDTLQDAWTSDYMQDIRQHFLDNKQFEGCRECWRMQRMGLRSMRYDSYQYGTTEQQVLEPLRPTRIEINASNVCNLKCRICYPNASSKWIKEHGELYGSSEEVYRNLPLPNLGQVKAWTESLEEVCFFGGEPLLSEENMELLDHFISTGHAGRISLLFNTNGTVFNDGIVERLRHFKRVRMYFSVDDIGARFEYQRKGAKWDEVAGNIGRAYRLSRSPEGRNIDFKICCTVSILNIYYFPEFFEWFGKNFPGLRIFWNLLFDPWRLNVQILPRPVKDIIRARLQDHVKSTYTMSEPETKTIAELVTFLNEDVDKPFEEFFRYVNRHDTYRKESFPETFPELYALIGDHRPKDLNWGSHSVKDIVERAIRESQSLSVLAVTLRDRLVHLPPSDRQPDAALKVVQSLHTKLHDRHPLVLPIFSAISDIGEAAAPGAMEAALFSALRKSTVNDRDTSIDVKLSLLQFCAGRSEEMLCSLAVSEGETLSQNIRDMSVSELIWRIDSQFRIFSSNAVHLLSGLSDWGMSNFFRKAADVCCPEGLEADRWGLCEIWSEFFRDTPHVTFLFMSVLAVSSEAELAERFLSQLSRLAAEDSAEPHPHLEVNLQIVGELLNGENRGKALPDALQTGRERYFQSLKIETQDLAGLIEARYGVLVTT